MSDKKNLILGSCIVAIGLAIGTVATSAGSLSHENINLTNYNQHINSNKDWIYADYLEKTVVSAIKDDYEVLDCEIQISFYNNEVTAADVRVISKDNEINSLETDILNYVSESLGISSEVIKLYIK